jgi:hypothetical protein
MNFNFNFGKKKPDIKQYAIVGIVLSSIIAALSQCTHIKENTIWDLLDEVQRRYFPQSIINDFIINDPEKLDRRVHRDVDRAIDAVTPEYDRIISDYDRKYKPRYSEKPVDTSVCYTDDCKALGGEMRIHASWVDD